MALVRTGYQLVYEQLSADPLMGWAAVIPWDTAIFGFPVASYRIGTAEPDEVMFRNAFSDWMRTNQIGVCSCIVAPTEFSWRNLLSNAGFEPVDLSLQVTLSLSSAKLPGVRSQLRPALPEDCAAIEAIAAESFSHGRYHADPRFSRPLANRRYSQWVKNALYQPSEVDRVFVLEETGRVAGFYHVTIEGDVSDLRLAAVAAEWKATMLGVELYAAMLHELRRQGIRRVVTSISAFNTNIINLYSMLGFRFGNPEMVYHWHAANQARS